MWSMAKVMKKIAYGVPGWGVRLGEAGTGIGMGQAGMGYTEEMARSVERRVGE